MQKALEQVTNFHRAFGHPINFEPMPPQWKTITDMGEARVKFKSEEIREIFEAFANNSLAEVADGLVDLRYFILGSAVAFGNQFPPTVTAPVVAAFLERVYADMRQAYAINPSNRDYQSRKVVEAEIILNGIAAFYGIPMDAAFTFVHEIGNMSKLGADGKPNLDPETGKVLKPEGWVAPDLKLVVGSGPPIAGATVGGDDDLIMVPRMTYILAMSSHSQVLALQAEEPDDAEETITMTKSAYIALRNAADVTFGNTKGTEVAEG